MGLDIVGYSEVQKILDWNPEWEGIDDAASYSLALNRYTVGDQSVFSVHPLSLAFIKGCFPGHCEGIESGIYSYQETASRHFSYSGYNGWRDRLSQARFGCSAENVEKFQECGLFWLINFTDNEGYINSEKSKLIVEDIDRNSEVLAARISTHDFSALQDVKQVFQIASLNGCVDFN